MPYHTPLRISPLPPSPTYATVSQTAGPELPIIQSLNATYIDETGMTTVSKLLYHCCFLF